MKAKSIFVPPPEYTEASPLPTLRSAMRLYMLVLIVSAAVIVELEYSIDIAFLRLLAAIFVFGGFTVAAVLLTGSQLGAIMGRRPTIAMLLISFAVGLTVFAPMTWMLLLISNTLGGLLGNLPPPLSSNANFYQQMIMFGVIIPLCQGFLFFGYLFAAAQGLATAGGRGRWRSVGLIVILFGLFGLFTAGFGLAAIPAYMILGLVGALLVVRSGSAWTAIVMQSGFYLAEPILSPHIISPLLGSQAADILSFPWLTLVVISAFLTFVLLQMMQVMLRRRAALDSAVSTTPHKASKPGRGWWLPLVATALLCIVIGYSELLTRQRNPVTRAAAPIANTGVTLPPLISTPANGSTAPQATNQKPQ